MIKNGWVICPKCGKKLFPINKDAIVKNLEYQCKVCKEIFKVNIESQEP